MLCLHSPQYNKCIYVTQNWNASQNNIFSTFLTMYSIFYCIHFLMVPTHWVHFMIYCDLQTTAQMNAQILEYYWVSFLGFLFVLSNISTLTLFLRTVFKPFNNLPWPLSSFSPLPQTNTLCRACSSPKLAYYFPAPVLPGSCSVQLLPSINQMEFQNVPSPHPPDRWICRLPGPQVIHSRVRRNSVPSQMAFTMES